MLGEARITHDLTAEKGPEVEIADYSVELSHPDDHRKPGAWMEGRVQGFRRRDLTIWDLLFRALRACVGDRNHIGDSL